MMHDPACEWDAKGIPCLAFSTDGTRLGAFIAHSMGTTDEDRIASADTAPFESDVAAEQADWEAGNE